MLATFGVSVGALIGLVGLPAINGDADAATLTCSSPEVVDGDTLRCGGDRIRLYGIDAPELPGHCRPGRDCAPGDPYQSTTHLRELIGGATLECRQKDIDRYGRIVARCSANGRDLSCGQLDGGHAIRRYGMILC